MPGLRLLVALVVLSVTQARDATFFVTDAGDGADATPGDGISATAGCVSTSPAGTSEANADGGSDTIQFSLTGASPHVIAPTSELPGITAPLTIQGPALLGDAAQIVIDGINAGASSNGLTISLAGSNCDISGIGVTRFTRTGVEIDAGACAIHSSVLTQNNIGIVSISATSGVLIGGAT